MIAILALFLAFGDVASIKTEPNLERRSDLAIENANTAIDNARAAYQAGDTKKTEEQLNEVRESVDLSLESLENSGKKPRNNSHYKKAELKIGKLLRRLAGFRDEMSVDDRKPLDDVVARLQEVHDRLLSEIMSKKR
jgi:hypothetical protein